MTNFKSKYEMRDDKLKKKKKFFLLLQTPPIHIRPHQQYSIWGRHSYSAIPGRATWWRREETYRQW
jgi:hypothetical protein